MYCLEEVMKKKWGELSRGGRFMSGGVCPGGSGPGGGGIVRGVEFPDTIAGHANWAVSLSTCE